MSVILHYDVHGERRPYLLVVHGMLSSRAQWADNLPALTQFCRPVVVELLGHGRSPAPDDASLYEPASYLRQFEELREELGAERWMVLGASLGGSLTLRYALEFPDRVMAHAFTNSMSALALGGWGESIRPLMEAQAQRFERDGAVAIERHPLNPARAKRIAVAVRDMLVADSRLHNPHGLALTGLHTVTNSAVGERVPENRVPTLLVVGEREERFRQLRQFAETNMPHLEVAAFDAGHAVNAEMPVEFNGAVTAFLRPYCE